MADYKVNNFYQGGYSTLDPDKAYSNDFTGYRTELSKLGITTNPQTANQIKEVSDKLASGLKEIDLTLITPKMIEVVSNQQLEDVNRISKLTGVDVSVHGPVTDVYTTGLNQRGYDELTRKHAEDVIVKTLEKSQLVKPDGNVNVTFHSSEGVQGSEWKVIGGKDERKFKQIVAVDRESGQMTPIKEEIMYYPNMQKLKPNAESQIKKIRRDYNKGLISEEKLREESKKLYEPIPLEKGRISTPEERLDSFNATRWDDEINKLVFNKERADEILRDNYPLIQDVLNGIETKRYDINNLNTTQREVYSRFENARAYLDDTRQNAQSLFNKAYKYGSEEDRNILKVLSENFRESLNQDDGPLGQSRAVQGLISGLRNVSPEMFVPVEDFAAEKAALTFGNAAFKSYKKFKDKAPIISIENPPIGQALATGEDLRNVIKGSREVFVNRLVDEENMNRKQAEKAAEKLIGATWDVGHINILRRQGLGKEEIIKESEKIRPFLKHVHLSDNFGLDHTELPMGMGNVPFKEIMEKLGKEGYEAKKIIEAGDWWSQQMNPIQASLEGLGAPMYANGQTPYWNQTPGLHQGTPSTLEGNYLPGINYQNWGTYFSGLPTDLGGSTQGAAGSRMSGRPME